MPGEEKGLLDAELARLRRRPDRGLHWDQLGAPAWQLRILRWHEPGVVHVVQRAFHLRGMQEAASRAHPRMTMRRGVDAVAASADSRARSCRVTDRGSLVIAVEVHSLGAAPEFVSRLELADPVVLRVESASWARRGR